ncbi:MAG: tripartite tricarboxylate transporter substrate binding protein [Betaproteobacteria bacterium]|nr:tripartite tricarboxylate transporter substrate binding protein [Betaproteobacteria bacterium]
MQNGFGGVILRGLLATLLAMTGAIPGAVLAQDATDYPKRPVRVVVSLAPGSSVDLLTRIVAQRLGEAMGQQFIVDARPGAAGMVGTQLVSTAPPDGYTLLATTNAPLTTHFAMYRKMEYSWEDFEPVMVMTQAPVVLMFNPKLGVGTIAELIALSKRTQGGLAVATTGSGSIGHFVMNDLQRRMGANLLHIPYKGGPPGMMALSTGEAQVAILDIGAARPFIGDGRVRALGIVAERRATTLPEVPTMNELGVPIGDIIAWVGLLAPKGTPREIVQKLGAETARALKDPAIRQRILVVGMEPAENSTPGNFPAFLRDEVARWRQRVLDAGLKAE